MAEKTTRSTEADDTKQAAAGTSRRPGLRSFVLARWRGEVPLRAALWWDMLCVGTTVNVVAAVAGMLLLAADLPAVIAAIVFFSPLPYNVLLLLSVWRSAERTHGPAATTAQMVSVVWIVLATAV